MDAKTMKTIKKTTQEVVTNKYVLYTVLFLAILNILALLATGNFISLAVFGLVGLLTSYFTKNMTIILLVTLVVSSFIHISKTTVEAMTNKEKKGKKGDKKQAEEEEDDKSDDEEHDSDMEEEHEDGEKGNDAPMMKKNKSKLNHQSTVQASYKNIHSILGSDNFKKMTDDTKSLLDQQNKLTESLNNMAPILKNAESLLGKFDMEKMTGMLDSLNLGASKKKKN
jgi:sortase (surface protein transpeptidase)